MESVNKFMLMFRRALEKLSGPTEEYIIDPCKLMRYHCLHSMEPCQPIMKSTVDAVTRFTHDLRSRIASPDKEPAVKKEKPASRWGSWDEPMLEVLRKGAGELE